MRRLGAVFASVCLTGLLACPPAIAAKKPPTLKLSMSNFRYCKASECSPLDVGYLRTSSGPVAGLDNPNAVINVKRGSIVTWTQRCGSMGCAPHNVRFENGSAAGKMIGFADGRSGRKITTKITQKAGTTIRYFCSVNSHYQTGMTAILKVVR